MTQDLERLGIPARRRRGWRWGLALALLAGVVGIAVAARLRSSRVEAPRYETTAVVRGPLIATVSATGNLEPRHTVEVGPEISGRVREVLVDANDAVRAGQVLAVIDTTLIEAQVRTARANLASSRASISLAETGVEESQTLLGRTEQLHARQLSSDQDFDRVRSTVARTRAEVSAARARSSVARAELDRIASDLDRARVVSPIDGIVLLRNVDPGQSVAATLSSPVFFQIAESLSSLTLRVNVDEADVGRVREGMGATFTVDAHPDRTFDATIERLHFAPRTVANVVTYQAELRVANDDLALRPGMTATATITTERTPDQLLVPNAALRFVPPRDGPFNPAVRTQTPTGPTVWVLVQGEAVAHSVTLHGTDGRSTAVRGEGIEEGALVITGVAREATP